MDGRSYRIHRMYRLVGVRQVLTLLFILPFVGQVLAHIPYTPSSLLYSPQQNGSYAYLLRPTDTNQNRIEFLSLNVSADVDTGNPPYTVLLDEAPFQSNSQTSAFIPVVDQSGTVKVYTGDCQNSESQGVLWQFSPDHSSSIGNGTWERFSVTEGQSDSNTYGPNYLSAGFTFAFSNRTQSSFYAFAGMCPYQNDLGEPWVAAANYSQTMIVLDPITEDNTTSYQESTTGDRAPPIAEAGFTITPLHATYAYSPGELRQQQDFLLIGGHTQQAFINMSELAIFSAPQNSWSFVTVESTTQTQPTELTVRDTTAIEPRSGHTAVLSPDGSKVIVFGGWVGNTSVPATPQLVVLEIGGGYMGSGEWNWKVPPMSESGISEGTGVYGHGAIMLPGGVMMVAGGYQISSQSSKRSLTGLQLNSQIYLYNVTSNSWTSSYQNPDSGSAQKTITDSSSNSASGTSSSTKAGLGVGIGLGVPAVAGLSVFGFYLCRRRRAHRSRDQEIRKLALGAQRAHFWGRDDPDMASSIRNPSMRETEVNSDYPWNYNNSRSLGRKSNWQDHGDAAAESAGLLGGASSPTKLNRLSLNAKLYRPPAQYTDYRRGETTGDIHPIDEREEDEVRGVERTDTRETTDPFAETAFLTPAESRTETANTALEHSEFTPGSGPSKDKHLLPDKSDRTSSSLSDSSTSAKSTKSVQISPAVLNNSPTLPSNGRRSPNKPPSISGHNREAVHSRDSATTTTTTTTTILSFEKRYSSDSYSTAHTSQSQRQAEGEFLLQDGPEPSPVLDLFNKPTVASRPRASEWIGNVRRVLSVTRKRPPVDNNDPNTASLASGIDGRSTVIGIPTSEPRLPRRSVSASAELFRRKQGARDWSAGNRISRDMGFHTARLTRDDFGLDGLMDLDSDEDWDVEGAAEGRRVQVTFTVPKEKLRVVNATAGDMDDLSEKSVSRSNSSS